MRISLFSFVFCLLLFNLITACAEEEETGCVRYDSGLRGEQFLRTQNPAHVDPTPYAFMDFDGFKQILDTPCTQYNMTVEDVLLTESIIQEYMDEHDRTLNPEWMVQMDSLKNYKRQYVSGINEAGDTIIYVSCFCETDFRVNVEWRKYIVGAFGGGSCFFRLKINLGKREYFDASTNAYC